MGNFQMDDYVPVNERIEAFYNEHPSGSIQTEIHTLTDKLVVVKASAFRSPDDKLPCVAHSQLSIPGKTSFTRDSEVENAETSAVGRALAMMGFEVKRGISSREEIQNKGDSSKRAKPATEPAEKAEKPRQLDPEAEQFQGLLKEARQLGIGAKSLAQALHAPFGLEGSALTSWLTAQGPAALATWMGNDPEHTVHALIKTAADLKAKAQEA